MATVGTRFKVYAGAADAGRMFSTSMHKVGDIVRFGDPYGVEMMERRGRYGSRHYDGYRLLDGGQRGDPFFVGKTLEREGITVVWLHPLLWVEAGDLSVFDVEEYMHLFMPTLNFGGYHRGSTTLIAVNGGGLCVAVTVDPKLAQLEFTDHFTRFTTDPLFTPSIYMLEEQRQMASDRRFQSTFLEQQLLAHDMVMHPVAGGAIVDRLVAIRASRVSLATRWAALSKRERESEARLQRRLKDMTAARAVKLRAKTEKLDARLTAKAAEHAAGLKAETEAHAAGLAAKTFRHAAGLQANAEGHAVYAAMRDMTAAAHILTRCPGAENGTNALVEASKRAFHRWDARLTLAVWRATAVRATGPGVRVANNRRSRRNGAALSPETGVFAPPSPFYTNVKCV
ncbi:hypothetical protein T484DRAFT_1796656 [Baffinella frigidus]|nr:hypothetical protein T484DRAFT_1796656 [Cryptophyta sp. CCMP2293]